MFNSGLIYTRDFNSFKPRSILLRHKSFDRIHEQSRKYFLKRSFMTKRMDKLPALNGPISAMSVCYSTVPPSCLPFLKFIEKYFLLYHNTLSSLSCYYKSVNLLRSSALYSKFVKKSPFLKICREKDSQFLECLEYSKSLAPSSKYLTCLEYLLKWKLLSPELCKQYFLSCSRSHLTCSHSLSHCSRNVSKNIQKISKKLPKLQRNKTYKMSSHRNLCYPIFLHRRDFHWRGFHSSLFPFAKSDSSKPSAGKKMDKIYKSTEKADEHGKSCQEKSDVCHQEKNDKQVKCDKQNEKTIPKIEKKIDSEKMDSECRKTCLPLGKCELPQTFPPPKMEYAKVTCPPPKFMKPKACPSVEVFQKDDKFDININKLNNKKKQICVPLPLPKPPNAPIVLCPCPPPSKIHPGPCPYYETKVLKKRPSTHPCLLKKKYSYPCPTGVHYCLPKKPSNLQAKRETVGCEENKKKKNTSAS